MRSAPVVDVVAYYRRVWPLLAPHLAGTPLVAGFYHPGDLQARYAAALGDRPAPGGEPTLEVRERDGRVARYLAYAETAVLAAAHRGASELHTWTPRSDAPERVRFARLLLRPATGDVGRAAALARCVRAGLSAVGLDGVLLLDGRATAAVWVPFSDGPAYGPVRAWLHAFVDDLLDEHGAFFGASELHVSSNAVGHWSLVPYAIVGPDRALAVTPVRWDDLSVRSGPLAPAALLEQSDDDVFGSEVRRIGAQRFAALTPLLVQGTGHGAVLACVRALLADGHAHGAEEICREGIARGLLPASTMPSYVQHAIATLLDRQRDRGETPEFVVLADGRYRRNVPVDPFEGEPEVVRDAPEIDALVARLRADSVRANAPDDASNAEAGAPFERDVADAFAALGFEARRLGGEGEPDVVATAPLGDRGYTVAIECKTTAAQKLHDSAAFVVEAARLRDAVGAELAVLIGPAFPEIRAVDEELVRHGVAMWLVEELAAVLAAHAQHPIRWSRLRACFAPGRAADAVAALLAEERFGGRKRALVTLRHALAAGLAYQVDLARADPQVQRVRAPLTVEALVVLVNQQLAASGELGRVGVEDVRAALAYAAHPLIGAVTIDEEAVYVERR